MKHVSRLLLMILIGLLPASCGDDPAGPGGTGEPFFAFTFDTNLEGWDTGTTDGSINWREWCGNDRPEGCVTMDYGAWMARDFVLPTGATSLELDTSAHNRSGADSVYRIRLVDGSGTDHVLVDWTETTGIEADVYQWVPLKIDISGFAGQSVRIFLEGEDNGPGSHEQRYFDNVYIR